MSQITRKMNHNASKNTAVYADLETLSNQSQELKLSIKTLKKYIKNESTPQLAKVGIILH